MSFYIQPALRRLRNDSNGNVAIIFGLALLPMLLAAGTAVDYSMASNVRTHLQAATDSAAIQLCQAPASTTATDLQDQAESYLSSFLKEFSATVDLPIVATNPRSVSLTTHAAYNTAIMKIAGYDTVPVAARATCVFADRHFEIALALDTTGSMNASAGGASKIASLRTAATDFVNYLFDDESLENRVKIAIVPFAAAVAVSPAAFANAAWLDQAPVKSPYHWQNVKDAAGSNFNSRLAIFNKLKNAQASWSWAGCLESLPYPLNVKDGKPSVAKPESYYLPMFAPDEPGNGGEYELAGPSPGKTSYYGNSYINDDKKGGCKKVNPATNHAERERRACKYDNAEGASTVNLVCPRGPNCQCRSRPLTRLTDSQTTLTTEIGALTADGNTNIHEGVMWGWRTISPDSVFGDGVAYTNTNTTKVIVLMTDGANTWEAAAGANINNSMYSAYGFLANTDGSTASNRLPPGYQNPTNNAETRAAMDELTRQACTNARNAGVVIYTIGFSVASDPIDAVGLALLADCAGAPERTFVANDSASLIAKFNGIAKGIADLRLSK